MHEHSRPRAVLNVVQPVSVAGIVEMVRGIGGKLTPDQERCLVNAFRPAIVGTHPAKFVWPKGWCNSERT
jgi:hypothetical protein